MAILTALSRKPLGGPMPTAEVFPMRHAPLLAERNLPGSSRTAQTRRVGAAVRSKTFRFPGPGRRHLGQAPGHGGDARSLARSGLEYEHPLISASSAVCYGMFFLQDAGLALLQHVPPRALQLEQVAMTTRSPLLQGSQIGRAHV